MIPPPFTGEQCRLSKLGRQWKFPACSCDEIAQENCTAVSGWYWIKPNEQYHPQHVFCNFVFQPEVGVKNWMHVLRFNMRNQQQECPSDSFRLVKSGGLRLCGRKSSRPGCASMYISKNNYAYREVSGSLIGYKYNTVRGFDCPNCTLDEAYVDGFSITYGQRRHGRKHVWTYYMPCAGTRPEFVGRNCYCQSIPDSRSRQVSTTPLFDRKKFYFELPQPTTQPLELRICGNHDTSVADSLLHFIVLYIK